PQTHRRAPPRARRFRQARRRKPRSSATAPPRTVRPVSQARCPMMRTPDGHGGIELSRFLTPPVVADHRNAPVNALGYLRVMFAVDDLDDTLAQLRRHGAQLVDEVVQYEDVYRLCYVRGPEGILIGLAEQIG